MQESMKFYAVKLSPEEEHIVEMFRKLTKEQKKQLFKTLDEQDKRRKDK